MEEMARTTDSRTELSVVCVPCTYGDTHTFLLGERQANLTKSGWKQLGLATHGVHGASCMQDDP
jgi:hypothetical protein